MIVVMMMLFDLLHALLYFQANKIMEHRRKYERKREEKEIRQRQERIKKAREEHARAQRVSCCQWAAAAFQFKLFCQHNQL